MQILSLSDYFVQLKIVLESPYASFNGVNIRVKLIHERDFLNRKLWPMNVILAKNP